MRAIHYREFSSQRRFGVELELSNNLTKQEIGKALADYEEACGRKKAVKVTPGMEGWAQSISNTYWHVKFDRTCGPKGKGEDSGWEVASYIGSGRADVQHIARAARCLRMSGGQTNLNCGLHIHAETKDFDGSQMGVLLARWLKVEEHLVQICHPSRRENLYCRTMQHRLQSKKVAYDPKEPLLFWLSMMPNDLNVHNNYEKRFTLNTVGFATGQLNCEYKRNTVELRLPECLLDESHVRNWTRLFLNFVDASQEAASGPENVDSSSSVAETLYYLGLHGDDRFVVLDRELLSAKIWFLQKLATSSKSVKTARQARKHLEFICRL